MENWAKIGLINENIDTKWVRREAPLPNRPLPAQS